MKKAKVIGEVWATKKNQKLSGKKLQLVVAYEIDEKGNEILGDQLIVAFDMLDAKIGEDVIVSFGSGARNVLKKGPDNKDILVDAAISQIIDYPEEKCS